MVYIALGTKNHLFYSNDDPGLTTKVKSTSLCFYMRNSNNIHQGNDLHIKKRLIYKSNAYVRPCIAPMCYLFACINNLNKYYLNLYTKFHGHQSLGFGEDFERFSPYMGITAILVM